MLAAVSDGAAESAGKFGNVGGYSGIGDASQPAGNKTLELYGEGTTLIGVKGEGFLVSGIDSRGAEVVRW